LISTIYFWFSIPQSTLLSIVLLESLSEREFGVSYQGLSRIWLERPVLILRKVPPPLTIPSEKKNTKTPGTST
jgi:hypothetical protein